MGAGLSPIHSKIFVAAGNYYLILNFKKIKEKEKNDVCIFKLKLVSSNSGAGILKPTFSHHTDAQRGQKWGLVSIFVHFFISLFFRELSPSLLTPLNYDGRTHFIIYP